jgi:hypothetical protein
MQMVDLPIVLSIARRVLNAKLNFASARDEQSDLGQVSRDCASFKAVNMSYVQNGKVRNELVDLQYDVTLIYSLFTKCLQAIAIL